MLHTGRMLGENVPRTELEYPKLSKMTFQKSSGQGYASPEFPDVQYS